MEKGSRGEEWRKMYSITKPLKIRKKETKLRSLIVLEKSLKPRIKFRQLVLIWFYQFLTFWSLASYLVISLTLSFLCSKMSAHGANVCHALVITKPRARHSCFCVRVFQCILKIKAACPKYLQVWDFLRFFFSFLVLRSWSLCQKECFHKLHLVQAEKNLKRADLLQVRRVRHIAPLFHLQGIKTYLRKSVWKQG